MTQSIMSGVPASDGWPQFLDGLRRWMNDESISLVSKNQCRFIMPVGLIYGSYALWVRTHGDGAQPVGDPQVLWRGVSEVCPEFEMRWLPRGKKPPRRVCNLLVPGSCAHVLRSPVY